MKAFVMQSKLLNKEEFRARTYVNAWVLTFSTVKYLMTYGKTTDEKTQKIIDRLYAASEDQRMKEGKLMRLLGKLMFELDARKDSFMTNVWKIASEYNNENFDKLFMDV